MFCVWRFLSARTTRRATHRALYYLPSRGLISQIGVRLHDATRSLGPERQSRPENCIGLVCSRAGVIFVLSSGYRLSRPNKSLRLCENYKMLQTWSECSRACRRQPGGQPALKMGTNEFSFHCARSIYSKKVEKAFSAGNKLRVTLVGRTPAVLEHLLPTTLSAEVTATRNIFDHARRTARRRLLDDFSSNIYSPRIEIDQKTSQARRPPAVRPRARGDLSRVM
ncbi:hypothetical protein EVAR_52065_1 [Eumeta japonica]|uniref:Uncharacterized protein n=1 Tax=Eumeta variegata TaxID=151549 RepID=A0A4C1Y121_EUMVA|nr:hypothetical protein EVAR_52065_1 [Eumeta japonica]